MGKREPEIYGRATLADVEADCRRVGEELGLAIEFHQSNREYELIDLIHAARERAAGIVINPAAFTHTSVAILDALNAFAGPIIEVHISSVHKREVFPTSFVCVRCRFGRHRGLRNAGLCVRAAADRETDRRTEAVMLADMKTEEALA